ncbi:hypothetical protein GCK72_026227 [Caenorhabditis remanei]|uniref:Uncharacterized protein n=1 Tax=Caenorhabditis remanei TaxID=31234 RepID=A0A6A5G427_CAERE|nr:hypothetical protein GCK72_026227 [Caenorhabditis remanei]KAF1749758.1 hypothetical protein GCK72_026227 [Caenorhabditis remanei]
MAFNRPAHKRKLTSSDDDLPLQFVPYSAYKELHNQVVALTSLVNQLRGAIIESGQNKLALEVAESCEQLSDMSPLADPIFQHHFSSTDSPALVDPPSKFPPVTAPIAPVATINSLDIAREAAKLLDKSTRVVIERMPDIHDNPKQESEDLDFFQKLATANRLPAPKKAHRHQCSSKFRPLKLQFDSSTDRDIFLHGYHKIRSTDKSLLDIVTKPRARRDLTKPELETLRASRKFCYDQNKIAGESKYIMSDINYKLNLKPRPFM